MIKKIIIILLVTICIVVLLSFMKYWNITSYIIRVNVPNKDMIIEQIVKNAIKIQYRGGDKNKLNRIFTSDFINQIENEPSYFYKHGRFHVGKINIELNNNQAIASMVIDDSIGRYISIMTLTRDSDGKYLLSQIVYDI